MTTKATSRPTRRVWLSTMPRNGNVSGAMRTQSVLTKKLAVFAIFESNTSMRLMSGLRNLDLSAASVRKACLSFPSKTAIGLDQHAFKDIALLPDNALGSLGEIIKLAIPTQSLLQLLVLLGKKNGGSRTITIVAHNIPSYHALGISTHQSMGSQFRWKVGLCTQGYFSS